MLLKEDTYLIFDVDGVSLYLQSGEPIIIVPEDGLKEPTPGATGSENFWLDMNRN